MSHPKLLDTPLYALLRKDDIAGFNSQRPQVRSTCAAAISAALTCAN